MGSARIDPHQEEYKTIFKKHQEKKRTEGERGRKRKAEESSDLPSAAVPEDPAPPPPPAPVPVTAAIQARKRGRPKKYLPEGKSDQSLADVFVKKKR